MLKVYKLYPYHKYLCCTLKDSNFCHNVIKITKQLHILLIYYILAIEHIDLELSLFTQAIYNRVIILLLQKDFINGFYLMMKLLKQLLGSKFKCKHHTSSFTKLTKIHEILFYNIIIILKHMLNFVEVTGEIKYLLDFYI